MTNTKSVLKEENRKLSLIANGRGERIAKIEKLVKNMRASDVEIVQTEPCCKENMQSEKTYCQFHYLMHKLEVILNAK